MPSKHNTHNALRHAVLAKYDARCAYCGKPLNIKTLTTDHILPASRGGKYVLENLNPACHRCNLAKANYTPEEWRTEIARTTTLLKRFPDVRLCLAVGAISLHPRKLEFYYETLERLTMKEVLQQLQQALTTLQTENAGSNRSRELSIAISELETATLWLEHDIKKKGLLPHG